MNRSTNGESCGFVIGAFDPASFHASTAAGSRMMATPPGIILAQAEVEAWKETGSKAPITTPHDSPFVGQFIGVKLCLSWLDQYDQRIRGNITLFVASVYHPVDEVEHADFTDTLSSIITSVPNTAEFIGGHDVNANLGIYNNM